MLQGGWDGWPRGPRAKRLPVLSSELLRAHKGLHRTSTRQARPCGGSQLDRSVPGLVLLDGLWKAAGAGLLPPEFDQQCPSCGEAVRDTREHLCLECPAYAAPRHTHLVGLLQAIEAWAGDAGLGGLSRSELVTLLLGGSVRGSEPPGLWLGASRAQNGAEPGWVRTSGFLGEVMPRHTSRVWHNAPQQGYGRSLRASATREVFSG